VVNHGNAFRYRNGGKHGAVVKSVRANSGNTRR
jgi:hypothetical protein